MSEIPNKSDRSSYDDLEPGLSLHTSPTALKQSQPGTSFPDQPNNDFFSDSDTSINKKSLGLRYSADNECSDSEAIEMGDSEQSMRLDSLADYDFQQSPYQLKSLQSNSSYPEADSSDTSTSERSSSKDQKKKRSKQRRSSLGPNELPKVALEENEDVVFNKNFKKLGMQIRPLPPLVESEEEHPACHPRIDSSVNLKNMIDAELALNECEAKDPYVLNINIHIPKEYTDQNIPLNVILIKQGNNPEIQPVNLEHIRTIDDIPPEEAAFHLNETLPVVGKTEPVDPIEESVPEPGPSKPSASKSKTTTARPRKTNSKEGGVENKPPPKKALKKAKPKENIKIYKGTSIKKGAKKEVTNEDMVKKETAKKGVEKKELTKKEIAKKERAKKGGSKKEQVKKPSKEDSKKGSTAKERLESVHGKTKDKNKHGKVNKKNKCKVKKLACKHCEAESSSESECSVCSGDYCRRSSSSSSEDCSCCSSDSSTCTCSSCQPSSTSDYESSD